MLTAGAAEIDISPSKPVRGWSDITFLVEPDKTIYAHALALKSHEELIVAIACDVIGFDAELGSQLETKIAQSLKISPQNVVLWGIHNHSSPCMLLTCEQFADQQKIGMTNQAWYDLLAEKLCLVASQAAQRLEPVTIAGGLGEIHGIAGNRLIKLPDGTFAHRGGFPPPTVAELRDYPEGNIDPFVRALFLLGKDNQPIAVLHNYACHPTSLGGGCTYHVNPDYPGYAADLIKAQLGKDVACLFGMGASGNINCGKYTADVRSTKVTRDMGEILGKEVVRQFRAIKEPLQIDRVSLESQVCQFQADKDLIPDLQTVEKDLEDALKAYRAAEAAGDQEKIEPPNRPFINRLFKLMDAQAGKDGTIDVDIRKLTFDSQACVLFVSGEYFVDIGKEIFAQSQYPLTYFVTVLNMDPLYIPDKETFKDPGGYGVSRFRRISQQGCLELAETLYQKVRS